MRIGAALKTMNKYDIPLLYLYLENNQIGDRGAAAVLEVLEAAVSCDSKPTSGHFCIFLRDNQIGPDIANQLRQKFCFVVTADHQKPVIIEEEKKEEKTEIVLDDHVASEAKHVLSKESRLKESLAKAHDEIGLLQVRSDSTTVTELMTIPTNEEEIETEVTGDGSW